MDRDYKLIYGIPTYTQFDYCRQAVEGIINNSSLVPDEIVIVDNSEHAYAYDALYDLAEKYEQVQIWIRQENILAGAWNDIMAYDKVMEHTDQTFDWYTIIANDDVFPHYNSIQAMVDAARSEPTIAMWNGSGHSGNSYSFFLLRYWAYAKVGPFDEALRPAYFEDNDYDWRIKLAGLIREEVSTATFEHIGSATMRNMTDERVVTHHKRFAENQRYYRRKWGELPGKERFKAPFERPIALDIADL